VKKLLTCIVLILLISAMLDLSLCYDEPLIKSVRKVYSRLAEAEEKSADVREASLKLQKALELIREAEEDPDKKEVLLSKASMLIDEVNSSIPSLIEEGERRIFWRNVMIGSTASLIVVAAVLVYRFGPKIFWETWLTIRSGWIVEVLERRERRGGDRDRR